VLVPSLCTRNGDVVGVTNRVTLGGIWAKEEAKYPFVASCEEPGCYFIVSARSEKQGQDALDRHRCPYGGDERAYQHGLVQPGSNLHEAVWEMLDSVTDGLMLAKADTGEISEEKQHILKGRASGLASVIMILASPYFDTVQDVSFWALERYRMRTGQREFEPTVGCEGYDPLRGEPSPHWVTKVAELRRQPEGTKRPLASITPRATPRKVPAQLTMGDINGQLPSEEVEGIKNALTIGVDDETIRNMFPRVTVQMLTVLKAEFATRS
jgi:hypothetical protein